MMSWSNGTTDPSDQYQQRPPRSGFFESIRGSGWYRAKPRVLGGVCSGISAHQGWDLSLVRVLMVVSAFFMPLVILAYGLAWLLLPEAEDGRIHVEETIEGRFDIAVIGGALMILAALSSMFSDVGVFGIMGIGWFMLIIVALSFSGIAAALVGLSLSRNRNAGQQRPSYGAAHYEAPRNNAPSAAPTPDTAGTSVPFAPATPAADGTGEPDPGMKPEQGPAGFPAYGVPSDFQSSPAGATNPQAGPRPAAATASVPHPGWTPPASAPTPRRWNVPPTPTHRPRTVSGRVNLAITGLLVLITAAVFAGLYWADKGLSIPFITGETEGQTIARIITIGGGVCLLVVGLSLAIAALRDRSAGWLTALSVIGIIMAFPTAAIGTQASHPTDFLITVHPGAINTETTRDWTVDRVSGGNPAGTTLLDLSGAPVGTTKTIIVDWEAWSRLTIQVPSWGNPSLGGITVLITDSAGLVTLTVLQTPDSSGTWGSKSTTTPSATPSATPPTTPSTSPSPTPTGSQSGN